MNRFRRIDLAPQIAGEASRVVEPGDDIFESGARSATGASSSTAAA